MLVKHKGKYYRNGEEITVERYNIIIDMLRNRPSAPSGYKYVLTDTLQWELLELEAEETEDDPELSDAEALAIITGARNEAK